MTYWQKEVTHITRGWTTYTMPLYYLTTTGKMSPTLWRLFGDKMFKVHFELQQQCHIDKRKGLRHTQYQRMNNIHHALYYLQPQGKMLPTLWRLFGDKTFRVQFGPQQQWHIDKRKGIVKVIHIARGWITSFTPCNTYHNRGRCCLFLGDFSGTKHSRYILDHNNNDIMTIGLVEGWRYNC